MVLALIVPLLQPVDRVLGDLAPAAVDGERVAAIGELDKVRDSWGLVVELPRACRDGPRDRVVLAACGQQQRPAGLVVDVDLRRRLRREVRQGGLE